MTDAIPYSRNAEANELFLKAREYFNKRDPRTGGALANAREAIRLYEQASQTDPKFALAYGYALAGTTNTKRRKDSPNCRKVKRERTLSHIASPPFIWLSATKAGQSICSRKFMKKTITG